MKVTLGNHLRILADKNIKEKVRDFYVNVLGCKLLPSPMPMMDIFEFEGGFILGIYFCDEKEVLTAEESLKATWLELKTPQPEDLKKRLIQMGVKEINYTDRSRFYFQAPGGQVYRIEKSE